MKFKRVISYLAFLFLISALFSGCGINDTTISLNLKKGEVYKAELTASQKITETVMGQNVDIEVNYGYKFDYAVQNADKNGIYTIKVTFRNIKLKQVSQYGTIEFDSSAVNASDKGSAFLKALLEQSFTMKIDKFGTVKSIEGIDDIINNSLNKSGADEKLQSSIKSQFEQMLNPDILKQQTEQSMKIYPKKDIKIGDTWSSNVTITKGMPMIIDTNYTLKDLKNGAASVTAHSAIKCNNDSDPIIISGVSCKYILTGEQDGTVNIAIDTGLIQSSEATQNIHGSMKGEIKTSTGAQTVEVPITVVSKVSFKMSK